jgi:exosortase E/protease (VPEID-CTERM system)
VLLPWRRWALAAAILLAEYLVLSIRWDVGQLRSMFWLIGRTGSAAPIAFLSVTAMVVLWRNPGPQLLRQLAATSAASDPRWGWLMSHLLAAAIFFPLSHRVLGLPMAPADRPALLMAAWLGSVALLVATVFGWAFPRAAFPALVRIARRPALAGLVVGLCAWLAGWAAQDLWPWLARVTLSITAAVMRPIWGARLSVEPAERLLGLGDFVAEIGEGCSGAEGMGLMAVLSAAYLIKFRQALALPRALLVVPVAMALSFLANVVRIALLIWIGDAVSSEVAAQGFHSKAGWVLTCAIAIGVLAWVRRSRWLARPSAHRPGEHTENPTATFLAPLLTGSALALLTGLVSTGFDRLYWLRMLGTAAALWMVRGAFAGAAGRPRVSALAVAAGGAVCGVWVLIAPHAEPHAIATVRDGLQALAPAERIGWLVTRALGAVVIAPLAEELAFRGFLLRRIIRDDFWEVDLSAAARHPAAVLISALVFGLLHGAFIAGTLGGIAYALVLRRRGKLGDAILAHALTNALLLVYTLWTGDWSFMA